MEYFPGRLTWDVTCDIFAKMNQTELCLQVQMELNDILPRLEPADTNPREMPMSMEERESDKIQEYKLHVIDECSTTCSKTTWPGNHVDFFYQEIERHKRFLPCLFLPRRPQGRQPMTVVLQGVAGVGKTTLAKKVPVVCWMGCSCLRQQMERGADLRQVYPNATALFVQYLSSLFPTKAGGLPGNTHQEQLRGLCYLAAEGMWNMKWVFDPEDLEHAKLEETAIATFLRVNIFQRVAGDQDCYTFAFMSFQEFFAALWYVLSSPQRLRNFQVLDSVHVMRLIAYPRRKKNYLAPMGLFLFGLLNETCALAA
uniref:NACHT domain-containing protein n=1 Tax=Felis catus TaxID=9685 RepID=A0ABI7ZSK5_FELCA